MARIAINGFGRIGRNILRAAIKRGARLDVVHINDIDKPKTLAHLFKYDSVHGIFEGTVESTETRVVIIAPKTPVAPNAVPPNLPQTETGATLPLGAPVGFATRPAPPNTHMPCAVK